MDIMEITGVVHLTFWLYKMFICTKEHTVSAYIHCWWTKGLCVEVIFLECHEKMDKHMKGVVALRNNVVGPLDYRGNKIFRGDWKETV